MLRAPSQISDFLANIVAGYYSFVQLSFFMVRALPTLNPPNRFDQWFVEYQDGEGAEQDLVIYEDQSKTILSKNESPDIGFRYSVNPYRGCLHGCAYCYARPSHEVLGFGAGTDFERKILVKRGAPELLRRALNKSTWQGDLIVLSGNTDCYQPIEQRFRLTRGCLEVCVEAANPVHIITKSALVERDLDLIVRLRERASVGVTVSIPFFDPEVARALEPYAPSPARRVQTLRHLSAAGIEAGVLVAPLVPGLSDGDLVPILEACQQAGAVRADMAPLRLPGNAAPVFIEALERHLPHKAHKVLRRVLEMRGGSLDDCRFYSRMQGQGRYLESVRRLFDIHAKRLGLDSSPSSPIADEMSSTPKRKRPGEQLPLFS